MSHFSNFPILEISTSFCPIHSKCKHSSLRSQCWMRLFLIFKHCAKDFFPIKGWACTGCVSGKRHEWWMFCSLPWRSNLSNALRKCPYFLQSYGIWTAFGSSFRHRRLHSKACRNCLLHPFIHFLRFTQNDNFVKIYLKLAWQQFCLIKITQHSGFRADIQCPDKVRW